MEYYQTLSFDFAKGKVMSAPAFCQDIDAIHEIEVAVEKEHAANIETLRERLRMFPEGFYVVRQDLKILGYVESCLWNSENFSTFTEIKDFSEHHNPQGRILYVIYMAVAEGHRRKGYGSHLIERLKEYAEEKGLDKVQLVAGPGFLTGFYKKLGFKVVRKLPNFHAGFTGTLMEYKIKKCKMCKEESYLDR
ncbi:MAG: GNAT family N-acetyltransferase [Candidatus Niyogibacteria bacterium]|nr:GNAT family N-acetyltransferase [Candidatus Niyogibacteria bacterium]